MYLKHGKTKTPEYSAWRMMRARCNKPSHADYPGYGGRGIKVCPAWDGFEQFLSDMGPRPTPEHSLDRCDNAGNYEPGNCEWVLPVQQCNNRRSNRVVTWNGVTRTLAEIARLENIHYPRLGDRLRRGWSLDDAVRQPPSRIALSARNAPKLKMVQNHG